MASLLVASSHEPKQIKMAEKKIAEKAAELEGIILETTTPSASKAKLEDLRAEFDEATKGGATPFGSGKAWADALEDIQALKEPPLIEQERQLNAADVSKDADDIQAFNPNFRATRKAMFGEIGKSYKLVIDEIVDIRILGNVDYDKSPRIQKVCWLQPFSAKNSIKKGRRQYPKTGDLPITNKLPDAIAYAFHDVGFTLEEFQRGIQEVVSPASYIDPGSRQKATDANVIAWDGTIPLPKELFDIYGFNTQPTFKVHGFKGELLSGKEMRITIDLTYNSERTLYTTVRTVAQGHKGGGIDYCAGNATKSAWFTEHERTSPTQDSYLFVLLKELGDFLQVVYTKMYMGHANPQICMFTNDRTVLGRSYKMGVPVCYMHSIKKLERIYENLGQCYYFRPNFDPSEQRRSLKLTYQKQALEHNEKVKFSIFRALDIQGTKADYGDVFYITCGGQDLTNIDGDAKGYPTIRNYLISLAEEAINNANTWLDMSIGRFVDTDTDESVETCKLLAARATAEIICNDVLEINKLRSLFKSVSLPPIPGIPPLVDPVAEEFRRSGKKLNDYIYFLSQQSPKKGASARRERGRKAGGGLGRPSTSTKRNVSKSRNHTMRRVSVKPSIVKRDQPLTGQFYDLSLALLQKEYSSQLVPLMKMDYYDDGQIEEFQEEYWYDLAYEFLSYIYNYLNYVGRTPVHTQMVSFLIDMFMEIKIEGNEPLTIEEFELAYRSLEAKEERGPSVSVTPMSKRTSIVSEVIPKGDVSLIPRGFLSRIHPTRVPSRTPASRLRHATSKRPSLAPVSEWEAGGGRRRNKTR